MAEEYLTPGEQIRTDLAQLRAALAALQKRSWAQVQDGELLEIVQLTETVNRELYAVQIVQTHQLERRGTAGKHGCTSTAVLLRQVCRVSVGESRSRALVAAATSQVQHPSGEVSEPLRPLLAAGLADGFIGCEAAGFTARFLKSLPAELPSNLWDLAERTMVEQATLGDATHLRTVAQELSIRLDPDGKLPKDKRTGMTLVFGNRNHAGYTPMTAMLDDETVEKIRQAVEALSAPAAAVEGISDQRSAANRRALALGEIAQHFLNSGDAPAHGRQRPNVTVFMGLDDLHGRIRPCSNCGHEPTSDVDTTEWSEGGSACTRVTDTCDNCNQEHGRPEHGHPSCPADTDTDTDTQSTPGADTDARASGLDVPIRTGLLGMLGTNPPTTIFGGPISAEVARRIACDSRITPIVLGGKGEILDVGRSRYTFPAGIRKALEARDRGCTFPGCDRPPGWTEAHHIIPFGVGGETKLSSAALACDHHHYLLHHSDWEIRIADDGLPEYLPPRWMDLHRTPRRNTRFL